MDKESISVDEFLKKHLPKETYEDITRCMSSDEKERN